MYSEMVYNGLICQEGTMKKRISAFLIVALMSSSVQVFATGTDLYKNQLEENNQIIDSLNDKKHEIEENKNVINSELIDIIDEINYTASSIHTLNATISQKESDIFTKSQKITEMTEKIEVLEANIVKQKQEIQSQEVELRKQEDILSARVRAAYKSNSMNNIIVTLIQSKSILDFAERLRFIETMAQKDREVMALIDSIISELEWRKATLEEDQLETELIRDVLHDEKEALELEKGALVSEKSSLEYELNKQRQLEDEKTQVIANLTAEEQRLAQEIGDIMETNEELEAEIQRIIREAQEQARREEEARRAEEARRKAEEEAKQKEDSEEPNPSEQVPVSTGFIHPIQGRISSGYGYRIHPIRGDRHFHSGIDYVAPYGAPIASTREGTVILVTYNSGYGNYVIIDHGNGMASLYAHLSSFAVGVGQRVTQGQTIGYIGSTGSSTGPHLHFEIRVNGVHRNPLDYVR